MSVLDVKIPAKENAQQKGRRYLVEGRLRVRHVGPDGVRAEVRGQGAIYVVEGDARGGWTCTCPARSRCAHLVATQLVVASPRDAR